MSVERRFEKVRSNKPAPIRSASDRAISLTTSVSRSQWPRLVAPSLAVAFGFRASVDSTDDDCAAGTRPKSTPTAKLVANVKSRGIHPTLIGLGWGMVGGSAVRSAITL